MPVLICLDTGKSAGGGRVHPAIFFLLFWFRVSHTQISSLSLILSPSNNSPLRGCFRVPLMDGFHPLDPPHWDDFCPPSSLPFPSHPCGRRTFWPFSALLPAPPAPCRPASLKPVVFRYFHCVRLSLFLTFPVGTGVVLNPQLKLCFATLLPP